MPIPYKTSFRDLLLGIFGLLVGSLILALQQFDARHGTTPETKLTLAKGIPVDVAEARSEGKRFLKFSVGPFLTEYASDRSRYNEVRAAVQTGKPIDAGNETGS